ncbi:MAG: T9SS type A sorting domain-containing protein [Bacteroidia bacterium]|nr:T9SS type A sorting domain-containing protein [Bacteroidia bacterium]
MDRLFSQNPDLKARFDADHELASTNKVESDSIPLLVIPVVFHIFHNNGIENISDEACKSQVEIFNEDFGKYGLATNSNPVSADTRIRFCLATVDPDGNPTTGIDRYEDINSIFYDVDVNEEAIMKAGSWDPSRYLNIFVVNTINYAAIGGTLEAYAYYPGAVANTWRDGVVTRYYWVGRIENAIGMGRVVTHEVGHYLNLFHPWGPRDDSSCDEDDEVDDTPLCEFPFYASGPFCLAPENCGEYRQIENMMDYSEDTCRYMFSYGQMLRMRNTISRLRGTLVSGENAVRTQCEQLINFQPTQERIIPFPNPAQGNFMVDLSFTNPEPYTLSVYDCYGQLMYQKVEDSPVRGPIPVSLTDYKPGIFWVILRTKTKWYKEKVVFVR